MDPRPIGSIRSQIKTICDEFNKQWRTSVENQNRLAKNKQKIDYDDYDLCKKATRKRLVTLDDGELYNAANDILDVLNNLGGNNIKNIAFGRGDLARWKQSLEAIRNQKPTQKQEIPIDFNATIINIPRQNPDIPKTLKRPNPTESTQPTKKTKKSIDDSDEESIKDDDLDEAIPYVNPEKVEYPANKNKTVEDWFNNKPPTIPQKVVQKSFLEHPDSPPELVLQCSPQKKLLPLPQKTPTGNLDNFLQPITVQEDLNLFDKQFKNLKCRFMGKTKGYWNEHNLLTIENILQICAQEATKLWLAEIKANPNILRKIVPSKDIDVPIGAEEIGIALHVRAEALLEKLLNEDDRFSNWKNCVLIEPIYLPAEEQALDGKVTVNFCGLQQRQSLGYPTIEKRIPYAKRGSLIPDVVILKETARTKTEVEAIFDFKFTTDLTKDSFQLPDWDRYDEPFRNSPYKSLGDQKSTYVHYFNLDKEKVKRIHPKTKDS